MTLSDWRSRSIAAWVLRSIRLVHAGQQDTLSWSNAYNRRHAYARPRQPGLETRTSNMPASTCQHRARHRNMAKHQVSTTDKTRHQIGKPEQPNGPPDVALQYCKLSCCRMHSCCSKTLKHLKHASRCKRRTLPLAGNYNTIVTDKTIRQVIK